MLPQLRKLEEKHKQELIVVGVEAGKYAAERVTENIRQALLRLEIEHPVVNDRHFRIWRSYAVTAWPTLALVDPEGYLLGTHAGETTFEAFDPVIEQAVRDAEAKGTLDWKPGDFWQPERALEPARDLAFPGKVVASGTRLLIADTNHNRVLVTQLARDGRSAAVLAIAGSGQAGLQDGKLEEARFHHPQGLAVDGDAIYVADSENHVIRRIDLVQGKVDTVAGTGRQARGFGGRGSALATDLSSPWDLALAGGALYIAMAGLHQVWRLDLSRRNIEPYAGSGAEDIHDDGLAGSALAQPMGIVALGGRIYFADSESSAIRWAELPPGSRVGTIVGTGLFDYGDRDGTGEEVRLQHAQGLTVVGDDLYVADSYNNKIKLINPSTRVVRAIFGGGMSGSGPGHLLYEPAGLSARGDLLYIADTNNHVIRVAEPKTGKVETLELSF